LNLLWLGSRQMGGIKGDEIFYERRLLTIALSPEHHKLNFFETINIITLFEIFSSNNK